MNKRHHLSSFRRSPLLKLACLGLLALMFAPVAMSAAVSGSVGSPALASIGGFNPMLIGAGAVGLGATLFLRDKASEGGDGGGTGKAPTPEAALQALEDRTMPMSQRLSVAAQALRGIDPTQQLTGLQAQVESAKASLTAKETELAGVRAELDSAKLRITALETDVKGLEQSNANLEQKNKDLTAKEQDIERRASEQAKQIVRSAGIGAEKLPASEDTKTKTTEDRIRELQGTKRAEAALYFKANGKLPAWMN